jgi:hypothetical protein
MKLWTFYAFLWVRGGSATYTNASGWVARDNYMCIDRQWFLPGCIRPSNVTAYDVGFVASSSEADDQVECDSLVERR